MRTLLLDCASSRGLLALVDSEHGLTTRHFSLGALQAVPVVPLLDEILREKELYPVDIDLVIVGVGPGSYTGIRIAASVAKSLAYAHQLPLIGVPSLAAFVPAQAEGPFAAVIDAKVGGIYHWLGTRQGSKVVFKGAPAVATLEEFLRKSKEVHRLVTPNSGKLKEKLVALDPTRKWTWEERDPDPRPLLKLGLEKEKRGEVAKEYALDLLYLRKTQAELERESQAQQGGN